jgi:hypothetical protein
VHYVMTTLVFSTSSNLLFTRDSRSHRPPIQRETICVDSYDEVTRVRMTAGAKEWGGERKCLGFAELAEYRINSVKRRVYLFSDLGRKKKTRNRQQKGSNRFH